MRQEEKGASEIQWMCMASEIGKAGSMALTVLTIEIRAGESLSNALDCRGMRIAHIGAPQDWTAAPLTFQIAALPLYPAPPAPGDYLDLFHVAQATSGMYQSYESSLSVVAGSVLLMPPGFGSSVSWLKLRSGTRGQPVVQAAVRTFTLVFDSG